MMGSIFDPEQQRKDIDALITVGISRLADACRVMIWEVCKDLKISPIQAQILIFCRYHPVEQCKVGYLAREFNLSKPTISDAVKTLVEKKLVVREQQAGDFRSYNIFLTESGQVMADQVGNYPSKITKMLQNFAPEDKMGGYICLLRLLKDMQDIGILPQQRMCLSCKHFKPNPDGSVFYCTAIHLTSSMSEQRIDCPLYEEKLV
jgi:DNA-binding MarR family transcriptional regulator